ncbi:MAG TPA: hypothetical protein VF468_22030, partial [Actinomycetota bacterium]|nr:hypothetical protein [Actinomycetota bacterium]
AGAVNLLAGSAGGPGGGRLLLQANPEDRDGFGSAIAGGTVPLDFDDTAGDDVAAGAPGETVGGRAFAGAVSVFNGPPGGLGGERLLFQGTAGIPAARSAATGSG